MIKIQYSKQFKKSFRQRVATNKNLIKRYKIRVNLFKAGRTLSLLRDHPLKGEKLGLRAFSIGGDLRIIYKEETNDTFIFLNIGTHNQVY